VEIAVRHTLNAHFVEAEVLSTVQFQHEAVSVIVATGTKSDSAFAVITCAGVTEVDEDEEPNAVGGGIAWTSSGLVMLSDKRDQRYAGAVAAGFQKIESVLRQAGAVLRWRFGLSGYDPVFKDTSVTAQLADGRPLDLHLIPQSAMGDDGATIEQGGLSAVAELVTSSQREPVAHELWREAWNLRHPNPRSSLVIGVAAAEVGLKQLIATLVPDAKSLVENIPSPSLDTMIRKVLPELPVRADVEPGRRAPRHLRTAIIAAVEDRNRIVHLGAMPRCDLREALLAIREFLYMLDLYSGHSWAATLLTVKTQSAMAGP
jgi:hypothetical protein